MIGEKQKRRHLGGLLKDPIQQLSEDPWLDSVIFIEKDNRAAVRTRAAALMYIHRNELPLTTMVKGEFIYIYKEKEEEGESITVDLRDEVFD